MFEIVKVHMCVSSNGEKYLPHASDISLKIDNRRRSVEFPTPIGKDIETRTPSFAQVCVELESANYIAAISCWPVGINTPFPDGLGRFFDVPFSASTSNGP